MSRLSPKQLLTAVTLVTLMAESVIAEWHHPLYLSGGGWWRQRIKVVVRNDRSRSVAGEPVALKVGSGPGEADLAGQSARAVRVCSAEGQEMLFSIVTPNGDRVVDGPITRGSSLLIGRRMSCRQVGRVLRLLRQPGRRRIPIPRGSRHDQYRVGKGGSLAKA